MSHRDEIARAAAVLSELRSKLLLAGHEDAAKLVQSAFRTLRRAGRLLGDPSRPAPDPGELRRVETRATLTLDMLDAAAGQQHPAKARRAARRARRHEPTDMQARTRHNLALDSSSTAHRPRVREAGATLLERWLREIRLAVLIGDSDADANTTEEILARATGYSSAGATSNDPAERNDLVRWLVRIAARRTPPPPEVTPLPSVRAADQPQADHLLRARALLARASHDLRARRAS